MKNKLIIILGTLLVSFALFLGISLLQKPSDALGQLALVNIDSIYSIGATGTRNLPEDLRPDCGSATKSDCQIQQYLLSTIPNDITFASTTAGRFSSTTDYFVLSPTAATTTLPSIPLNKSRKVALNYLVKEASSTAAINIGVLISNNNVDFYGVRNLFRSVRNTPSGDIQEAANLVLSSSATGTILNWPIELGTNISTQIQFDNLIGRYVKFQLKAVSGTSTGFIDVTLPAPQ